MYKHFSLGFLFIIFSSCSGYNTYCPDKDPDIVSLYLSGVDVAKITGCTIPIPNFLDFRCICKRLFNNATPKLENDSEARFFGVDRLTILQQLIESGNDVNGTNEESIPKFSECGVYPACYLHPLENNYWSFTCDRPILYFIAAIGIFLSALVIICNVLIVAVTVSNKSLKKPHSYFKLSLAFADLLAGVFVIPSIVHNSLNTIDFNKQIYNVTEAAEITNVVKDDSAIANFFGIMGVLSTITVVFSLLGLAVDSYLSVVYPLRYKIGDLNTKKKAMITVIAIWIFSLLLALLPLITKSVFTYGLASFTFQFIPLMTAVTNEGSPLQRFPHAFAYAILVWGIPFLVTWVLIVMTSVRSRMMLKQMREARKRSVRSEKSLDKVDRDLVRTAFVVLTTFTITVLPVFGVGITVVFTPISKICYSRGTVLAFFLATYIFICGRFLNVIIYNVFNKEFRIACRLFFRRIIAFLCCVDQFEASLFTNSSAGKKTSGLLSTSNEKSSETKSQTRKTDVPCRLVSASTSASTDIGSRSPISPKSIGQVSNDDAMYTNSAFAVSEVEQVHIYENV